MAFASYDAAGGGRHWQSSVCSLDQIARMEGLKGQLSANVPRSSASLAVLQVACHSFVVALSATNARSRPLRVFNGVDRPSRPYVVWRQERYGPHRRRQNACEGSGDLEELPGCIRGVVPVSIVPRPTRDPNLLWVVAQGCVDVQCTQMREGGA